MDPSYFSHTQKRTYAYAMEILCSTNYRQDDR